MFYSKNQGDLKTYENWQDEDFSISSISELEVSTKLLEERDISSLKKSQNMLFGFRGSKKDDKDEDDKPMTKEEQEEQLWRELGREAQLYSDIVKKEIFDPDEPWNAYKEKAGIF